MGEFGSLTGSTGSGTVLDDVREFLARFVVYPSEHELVAHTLCIAHTWLMDSWDSTPRIAFLTPEPGSGKSRALEVTEPLVPRPVHAVNTTPAYLFRKVSDAEARPQSSTTRSTPCSGRERKTTRTSAECSTPGTEKAQPPVGAWCAVRKYSQRSYPPTALLHWLASTTYPTPS